MAKTGKEAAREFYQSTDDSQYGEFDCPEQASVGFAWMDAFAHSEKLAVLREAAKSCAKVADAWIGDKQAVGAVAQCRSAIHQMIAELEREG